MSEKCPTCESPVEIKGRTTHYYVSENESLRTENAALSENLAVSNEGAVLLEKELLATQKKLEVAHALIRKCNSVVYCDYDNCGDISRCRQCRVCDEIDSFLFETNTTKIPENFDASGERVENEGEK